MKYYQRSTHIIGIMVIVFFTMFSSAFSASPPQIDNCLYVDAYMNGCELFTYNFIASDPDLPNDNLTWHILSGPGTINSSTGEYVVEPIIYPDIYPVEIEIRDDEGMSDYCNFDLISTNYAPEFTSGCNEEISAPADQTTTLQFTAIDDDDCLEGLTFAIVDFNGPGPIEIDPITGLLEFMPSTSEVGSIWTVEVSVYDGFDNDFCAAYIWVISAPPNCCLMWSLAGDPNKDGNVNLTDILDAISYVYVVPLGEPQAVDGCNALYDVNGDGQSVNIPNVNLTDILDMISHVYVVPLGEPVLCCPPGCLYP